MTAANPSLHLLVLERHDLEVDAARARAEAAWAALRACGLRVTVQHEHYAFEVLASDAAAATAMGSGFFSSYCRGPVDVRVVGSEPAAQRVAAQWNVRFDPEYRRQYYCDPKPEDRMLSEVRHFAHTCPSTYGEILERLEITTTEKWNDCKSALHGEATATFRKKTSKSLREATKAAGPQARAPVDPVGTKCTMTLTGRADAPTPKKGCHGRIAIGVVLVQLTEGLCFSGPAQEHRVIREVIDGLAWLVSEHPNGDLTFVLRFEVPVPVAPSPLPAKEQFNDVLKRTTFELDGTQHRAELTNDGIDRYRKALGTKLRCKIGKAIVITPHANDDFAVGYTETHTWVTYFGDWRGHGTATLDGIIAHELLHHFGAYDEYMNESLQCDCVASKNLDEKTTPNGNCPRCTTSQQRCVMNGFERRLCAYTRAAIGWYDLFVELKTSAHSMAGVDDRLWLDLGDRVLPLDTWEHDDHEPSQRAGYCFWGVGCDEIKRILLRKQPGSLESALCLEEVGVWYRGGAMRYHMENPPPSRWLDDVTSCWAPDEGIVDDDYVTILEVELVTRDHEGSRSMRLWLDDRSWVLPCSIPTAPSTLAVDQYSLDPGTGLRRSQLRSIRLERVPGHGGAPAPSPTAVDALTIRSNRKLVLATGPLELDASQWVWPFRPA